jgi:helicase
MDIDELAKYGIPEEFVEKFKEEKISELYPPQEDIIRKNLFRERNLVVSMPTAGGKTFIAALAAIERLSMLRQKVIYIVPMVALANEKYEYFKKLFDKKYRVAISVGNLDSADPWLSSYDLVICTTEKLDSLMRHGAEWLRDVGLVIVDEVHLINDPSRGPTLEILLTMLREVIPRAHIFALSATIKNATELAKWLNASLLLSDFRPVKLYEGVAFNSKIQFYSHDSYELSDLDTDAAIVENTLRMKKQLLIFVSTRKNAEKLAKNLCKLVKGTLPRSDLHQLQDLSSEILNILEIPTSQCKNIADCVKNGVAFHHAGLIGKQKRLIEDSFRSGLIKTIVATPTLALGVNLPAFRVVIRDAKRFYQGIGSTYIPVLEYKQFIGRAGRPQYDEFGESILVARSEDDAEELVNHFILGETEEIRSKLAIEPVLRMHTLALIASEFCKSEKTLLNFFGKTFYAFQYGDISLVEEKILDILDVLVEWKFVSKKDGRIIATRIGKRVAELYIDPLTAHEFIQGLSNARKRKIEPITFLQAISNTIEMRPLLAVRNSEIADMQEFITKNEHSFLRQIPEDWDLEFEDFMKSMKTAQMFEDWINELTEDQILEKYKVAPGELRSRLENADWLIYSMHELALLLGHKELLNEIRKVRLRLDYGIKEELLSLVKLKQVGRVRARKLFSSNLKRIDDLRKIPLQSLERIVGPKVAQMIKDQLEGKEIKKSLKEKQSTLTLS